MVGNSAPLSVTDGPPESAVSSNYCVVVVAPVWTVIVANGMGAS